MTRIYSWNVNGIRSATKKGFVEWLTASDAEIVALQEVRARPEQIDDAAREVPGYDLDVVFGEKKGYSGVGIYSRRPWDEMTSSLGAPIHDLEGRLQFARFGELLLVNGYFPNGGSNNRVPFKLEFYALLFERLKPLIDAGEKVLVVGDFNTAHKEIDIARPKANTKKSGFLPEERAELTRWIDAGWVDTFRAFDQSPDKYTWWSQRGDVRARNVGWRIDYVLASPAAMAHVTGAAIHADQLGSDHCPISVDVNPAIFGD